MGRRKQQPPPIAGTLSVHPRGFGFVTPDDKKAYPQDIFIPKPHMESGADGDHVMVTVEEAAKAGKGPAGKIVEVVQRARTHIAGVVSALPTAKVATVYVPLFGPDKPLFLKLKKKQKVEEGDRILIKVTEWGDRWEGTYGTLEKVIGHISDPSDDNGAAILEFELRHTFPEQALKEAKTHGSSVSNKDLEGRTDYRDVETVTIDPETAKDFDDALSLSKDQDGHYHLAVHIADVSHYVRPGTTLDEEAARRCNSTYLPGQCLPMLPHELSDQLCSLRPDVNRLAITVQMELAADGRLLNQEVTRSVIRSDKRFTYAEARAILEGKKSKHSKILKLMEELCHRLKQLRASRGSVELALPEAIIMLDEQGAPTHIHVEEYDITHQMVEEFMLKANEVVAKHLDDQNKELPYRIHDSPPSEDLKDFAILARSCGFKISDEPTQEELQQLFYEVTDTSYAQLLSVAYIRCQQMAIYSPDNVGHHGLALEHYCHFTSPIRRYADLVIHRTLFGHDYTTEALHEISERSTEQERLSARAEERVKRLKKLRLLLAEDEKDPLTEYEAIVTSVKPFGVALEVTPYLIEGFIHVSQIGSDYYHFDERTSRLIGEHTGQQYRYGDKVKVILHEGDLITGETQWAMIE